MEQLNIPINTVGKLSKFEDAKRASVTFEGEVRLTVDGSTATATNGHKINNGSVILQNAGEIRNFQAFGITEADVQASYIQ